MKPVKLNILEKALTLFNEKGFLNVRLQHIADSAGLSVGNLAYHFKNKEEIIFTLYDRLKKKQEALLKECIALPLFEDIDFLMRSMYALQLRYLFFYVGALEILRGFPVIAEKHRKLLLFQRRQIQFIMEFNISRGSFMAPVYEEQLERLSHIFCMTMDNWMSYQYINGTNQPDETSYCNDLWSILRLLFTDMGEPEFRQLNHSRLNEFYELIIPPPYS